MNAFPLIQVHKKECTGIRYTLEYTFEVFISRTEQACCLNQER